MAKKTRDNIKGMNIDKHNVVEVVYKIRAGFRWKKTKEGWDYWYAIVKRLEEIAEKGED